MTKAEKQYQSEGIASLHKRIKPGDKVYTSVKHVAKSGMSRSIACFIVDSENDIVDITGYVAAAINCKLDYKNGGLKIAGCGMNMCFAVVYELGCVMWPNGTDKPHGTRNGEPDNHGGYALKYRDL
jgi:hypothetical protein